MFTDFDEESPIPGICPKEITKIWKKSHLKVLIKEKKLLCKYFNDTYKYLQY